VRLFKNFATFLPAKSHDSHSSVSVHQIPSCSYWGANRAKHHGRISQFPEPPSVANPSAYLQIDAVSSVP
jgi:hypothetical protein